MNTLGAWAIGAASSLCALSCVQASTQASFQVTARVTAGCQIDNQVPSQDENVGSFGKLNFGTQSALSTATVSANLSGVSSVRLSCTPGVTLAMQINGGQHSRGGQRYLQSTTDASVLPYQLYSDSGYSVSIPIDGHVVVDTAGAPIPIRFPIFGRLSLPGLASAGVYKDTLLVLLSW